MMLSIVLFICLSVSLASADVQKLVFISDTHLDPYYNSMLAFGFPCKENAPIYGTIGCDSPELLIDSTISDIRQNSPDSILLFAGDWVRHEIESLNGKSNVTFLALDIIAKKMASLNSDILPMPSILSIGNNDFNPNYYLDINKKSQTLLEGATDVLTKNNLLDHNEAMTFRKCAFYKRRIGSLVFIVLNTMLYSTDIRPPIKYQETPDPCGQFSFLEVTLQNLPQETKAIILSHIPPTIDLYNSLVNGKIQNFLNPEFLKIFKGIMKKHSKRIVMQFYGHVHKTMVLADTTMGVPGIVIGAICPVRGNIPSYLTAQYDTSNGYIDKFHQRSFYEGKWSDYSGVLDVLLGPFTSVETVQRSIYNIMQYTSNWEFFQKVYAGGVYKSIWPIQCLEKCRKTVVCSMLGYSESYFAECLEKPFPSIQPYRNTPNNDTATTAGVIILCVLSFSFAIIGMMYVGFRFRYFRGGPTDLEMCPLTKQV